ncbi:hypothetical protein DFR39_101340 [Roseateles asaccharophilus]|uniref:Uncharacterized protein n=1 Tax=Roseateles asaccharophilus TaxID=582607 RepID=A0A4R6NAV7_9BURK|nr:hypothetical protein DFR39_101340 [Roseateles asaccharophilus]
MRPKTCRRLLGLALVLAGASLNADYLISWMRHSQV